jgi:hypothetical protein
MCQRRWLKAWDAFTIKILTSKTTYKFRKRLQTYQLTLTNLNLIISKTCPKNHFQKLKKLIAIGYYIFKIMKKNQIICFFTT